MKALYNTLTNSLLPWPRADDGEVQGLESHLAAVTLLEDAQPPYNPITHALRAVRAVDLEAMTYTTSWQVEELPNSTGRAALAAGYQVQPEGFALSLQDRDRDLFSQMAVLMLLGLHLGGISNDTVQTMADKDGQVHQVTTLRFLIIMLGYGAFVKSLWDAAKAAE